MTLLVLQSKFDPDQFVITNQDNFDRTVKSYGQDNPGDELIPAVGALASSVLEQVPDINVVYNFIDFIGYYGHSV